jgi:hypothetical protein
MTRDSIIAQADKWTEKKGAQFDLLKLYQMSCQHICKQNRFWWRKIYLTFPLVIGTATYDLTSITTTPTLVETGAEEIVKWTIITATAPSLQTADLDPIFDDDGIFSLLESTATGQPSRYVMGVDALQTLRIDPPDRAYKTRLTFWGMPNFSDDSTSSSVPLIPAWYHNAIVEEMAATIFESAYGAEDIRAITMRKRAINSVMDMQIRPRYTTNYTQQFSSQEDAIQST